MKKSNSKGQFKPVTISRKDFSDFIKSVDLLSSSTEHKHIEKSKELFKHALSVKNISVSSRLSDINENNMGTIFKPLVEIEAMISKIHKYIHESKHTSLEIKRNLLLEEWDTLTQIFVKHNMKKYVVHCMKMKGDICFTFHLIDKALFEYRIAVRNF